MIRCMRTNIVLNPELLREAQRYSGKTSKTALVEEALRLFVEVRGAEERRRTYRQRVGELQAKLDKLRLRESSLTLLRSDRERL